MGALVAAGGTGKTTLLLALGICHATGRQFFGLDVMVGAFVLISNDDPQDDLEMARDEVMRAMGLDDNEVAQVAARLRLHSVQGEAGTKAFTCQVRGDIESTGLDH